MDEGLIHPASLLQDVPRRFSDYRPGNFDSGFHGPVSASDALVRSLNLPAVGARSLRAQTFRGEFAQCRVAPDAALWRRAESVVDPRRRRARLEDIVAAYSAFARHGKAARLRMTPGDPLVERALISPGRRGSSGASRPAKRSRFPMPHSRKWCRWHGRPAPATGIAMRGRWASMRVI